jgi:hypothetical protein
MMARSHPIIVAISGVVGGLLRLMVPRPSGSRKPGTSAVKSPAATPSYSLLQPLTNAVRFSMGFSGPVVGRSKSPLSGAIHTWQTPPVIFEHPEFEEIEALLGDGQADCLRCIVVLTADRSVPKPKTCWSLSIASLGRAFEDFNRVDRGIRVRSPLGTVHIAPADCDDGRNIADRHEAAWLLVPSPLLIEPSTREIACAIVFVSPNRSERDKEYWRQRARQGVR